MQKALKLFLKKINNNKQNKAKKLNPYMNDNVFTTTNRNYYGQDSQKLALNYVSWAIFLPELALE